MKSIKEILNKIVEFALPSNIKCIACGDEIKDKNKYNMCPKCLENLPYNNEKICEKCGTKITSDSKICDNCFKDVPKYQIARAPFIYTGKIRNFVNSIKFANAKYLFKPLSNFMVETYKKYDFNCDIIVPVPLSKKNLKERHYNQAEEFAKLISQKLEIPVYLNAVEKIKETEKQSKLSYTERLKNVKNAFKIIDKKSLKGKNVLLVDDVITTGATINEVCKEILKAKPKDIFVLTLAHTFFEE